MTLAVESYELWLWAFDAVKVLFIAALGACIGSLTNVLVYRLPRGLNVVTPPSACPACGTQLTFGENIPIFGWLLLKGRCRFCRVKISSEYPLVEAFVAALFVFFFVLYYMVPTGTVVLGFDLGSIKPRWMSSSANQTWPSFAVLLTLLSSLVAMTLVDAKTSTIPLILTWVPALVAVLVHPIHAYIVQRAGGLGVTTPGEVWTLATPGPRGWGWIGASIGGVVGLGIGNLLLATGLIRRSFADYEAWEKQALAEMASAEQAAGAQAPTGLAGGEQPPADVPRNPGEMWIAYPHARREMVKELVFLAPCLGLAMTGWWLARMWAGPWKFDVVTGDQIPSHLAPLWLAALGGVLMGYLIGGGVVWAVRIFGSLGFGKESMGLGDVHMMAAVGACIGWINSVLGFFGAAFVGLAWVLLGKLLGGRLKRVMPYGPFLAVSTVLVLVCKPLLELGLRKLTGNMGGVFLP